MNVVEVTAFMVPKESMLRILNNAGWFFEDQNCCTTTKGKYKIRYKEVQKNNLFYSSLSIKVFLNPEIFDPALMHPIPIEDAWGNLFGKEQYPQSVEIVFNNRCDYTIGQHQKNWINAFNLPFKWANAKDNSMILQGDDNVFKIIDFNPGVSTDYLHRLFCLLY